MSRIALTLAASALVVTGALAGDPIRPDPALTPGVLNPAITDVCKILWGRDERHVTLKMKQAVFAEYGINYAIHSRYEVDHLISRELGGADDIKNLWPQSYSGPLGAHQKDRLENQLHRLVCSGALSLSDAQREISADWIASYKKRIAQ